MDVYAMNLYQTLLRFCGVWDKLLQASCSFKKNYQKLAKVRSIIEAAKKSENLKNLVN